MNSLKNLRALRLGAELVIPIPSEKFVATVEAEKSGPRPAVQARRPAARVERPEAEVVVASARVAAEVPGKSRETYEVQSGDSLWTIGQKFGVSVADLRQWNVVGRAKRSLQPGSRLVIWR
jgi:membrane-bound lytic murein transglycosylase D